MWELVTEDCGCCYSIFEGDRWLVNSLHATAEEMRLMFQAPKLLTKVTIYRNSEAALLKRRDELLERIAELEAEKAALVKAMDSIDTCPCEVCVEREPTHTLHARGKMRV